MINRPPSFVVENNPLKPKNQLMVLGAMVGVGGFASIPISLRMRGLTTGTKVYAAHVAMADAYPAAGSTKKLGVRYGGTGEVTTMAQAMPITRMYGPVSTKVPIPDFGFGLTAVPNDSQRLVYERNKSRGGQHTASSRMARYNARKSMRGPSAQKQSGTGRRKSTYFRRDEDRYT